MEMIRRSGQQGVPVVATEDEVILGFDQVRLKRLADKLAAPKRPPLGVLAADAEEYLSRHPEKAAARTPSGGRFGAASLSARRFRRTWSKPRITSSSVATTGTPCWPLRRIISIAAA
jgi:hypothetical protein